MTTDTMDVVLVGLPGSGKTAVGRRLARRHDAAYIDLDEQIEAAAGRPVPAIFADEGESGFRQRERDAVLSLGPPTRSRAVERIVATGGGTPIDPRNRWWLYRDRFPIWLDGPPEVLAQRLQRSRTVRPLVQGRDPVVAVRALAAARARFYAPALHVNAVVPVGRIIEAIERHLADEPPRGAVLLRAETPAGTFEISDGRVAASISRELGRLGARRAILVSEPRAWDVVGSRIASRLRDEGLAVEVVLLPRGEGSKRLRVVERAARQLADLRVERREPIVAIGGGALTDTAGFLAAVYLRGVPVIQVPTTLVAQIDAAIGGKTAVDLPEGKNLVGAFHQPSAVLVDIAVLASLPVRERRAALGESVKMGALGDERLLELLESDGAEIAAGTDRVFASGAVAELVERAAWGKIEVVVADEREQGARITLNLGHSVGHAIEAAAEYRGILHGEAVAHGLRAACRIGAALDVTPASRAARIEALLTSLGLAIERLPYPLESVLGALGTDKKHQGGRLHWVIPTAAGVTIRSDVPDDLVRDVVSGLLEPASAATNGRRRGTDRATRHARRQRDARAGGQEPAGAHALAGEGADADGGAGDGFTARASGSEGGS